MLYQKSQRALAAIAVFLTFQVALSGLVQRDLDELSFLLERRARGRGPKKSHTAPAPAKKDAHPPPAHHDPPTPPEHHDPAHAGHEEKAAGGDKKPHEAPTPPHTPPQDHEGPHDPKDAHPQPPKGDRKKLPKLDTSDAMKEKAAHKGDPHSEHSPGDSSSGSKRPGTSSGQPNPKKPASGGGSGGSGGGPPGKPPGGRGGDKKGGDDKKGGGKGDGKGGGGDSPGDSPPGSPGGGGGGEPKKWDPHSNVHDSPPHDISDPPSPSSPKPLPLNDHSATLVKHHGGTFGQATKGTHDNYGRMFRSDPAHPPTKDDLHGLGDRAGKQAAQNDNKHQPARQNSRHGQGPSNMDVRHDPKQNLVAIGSNSKKHDVSSGVNGVHPDIKNHMKDSGGRPLEGHNPRVDSEVNTMAQLHAHNNELPKGTNKAATWRPNIGDPNGNVNKPPACHDGPENCRNSEDALRTHDHNDIRASHAEREGAKDAAEQRTAANKHQREQDERQAQKEKETKTKKFPVRPKGPGDKFFKKQGPPGPDPGAGAGGTPTATKRRRSLARRALVEARARRAALRRRAAASASWGM